VCERFCQELRRDLIIDPEIQGQIGWEDLLGVARVPKRGGVVEVVSLVDWSSYVWGMNTDPTTKVYCTDPWVCEHWIIEVIEKPQEVQVPITIPLRRIASQVIGTAMITRRPAANV